MGETTWTLADGEASFPFRKDRRFLFRVVDLPGFDLESLFLPPLPDGALRVLCRNCTSLFAAQRKSLRLFLFPELQPAHIARNCTDALVVIYGLSTVVRKRAPG